jgi:hypothetical protein
MTKKKREKKMKRMLGSFHVGPYLKETRGLIINLVIYFKKVVLGLCLSLKLGDILT